MSFTQVAGVTPDSSPVVGTRHHELVVWGTPHVIRVRVCYEKVRLTSACPRRGGDLLHFGGVFKSLVSMVPVVDLLVLDQPINLTLGSQPASRGNGHRGGYVTAAAVPGRPAGMLNIAIKLDDPRIGSKMLIAAFVNIHAIPPNHIIFLCDDVQLRDLVAGAPTNCWGLRAIRHHDIASFYPDLFDKATEMLEDLEADLEVRRKGHGVPTYSFALDWDHRGLGPGE